MVDEKLIKPKELMYFIQLSSKSAFWKLEDIFPECFLYREQAPRAEALICLRENSCPVNHNCMEILARRLHAIFDDVMPKYVKLILLYYKKINGNSVGAGVFWRDFREPRIITVNPGGWKKVKQWGEVYRFTPGDSFFLSGKAPAPEAEVAEIKSALP